MAVDSLVNLLLAEAGGKNAAERYSDMLHIASTIANRAQATGKTVAEIIGAPGEFSAWGKPLPPGVEKYSMLAQRAIEQVAQHGSVTAAQFYATPKATDNLPKGLKHEGRTAGHVYFSDPQGRAIETTGGYVKPMPINLDVTAALPLDAPRPYSPNTFQPQLVAPQLPDLGTVPARSVATTQVAPPMSMPVPSVPAVPVTSRSITPGAGLANLAPNGIQERGTREGLSFIGDRQVFPGIGLGNLAPFNERAALAAGVEPDQFAFAPGNRGLYPASGIAQKVADAADDVLPGVKTTLYSGQERKGQAPVGDSVDRHPRGYAGDFYFEQDGSEISDPAFFKDLSLEMAARHDANIGYSSVGRDARGNKQPGYYMGPERAHFDTMPLGVGLPGGAQWGATANAWAPELQFARDAGRTLPGWGASRNDPIPTPMTREAALSLPAVPSVPGLTASPYAGVPAVPALSPTVPNFAGGLSPRGAQDIAPAAPQVPAVPSVPSVPGMNNFAPMSAREAQEASMASYRGSQSAIEAMIGDRAPAVPGVPSAPAVPSVPQSVIDGYQQYGQSRAAAPAAPVVAPQQQYAPQAVPAPQISNEVVPALPPVAPMPASSPRNAGMDFVRGGITGGIPGMLLGPATSQIGRNVRSNMRGEKIGLFKGIPQAYRNAFQGVRSGISGMFGGVPSVPSPFSVGSGLGAIQSVMSGGLAPGATAYSVSHPGASWSVNGNGIAEFTSQHGFSGPVPDNW